MLTLTSEEQRWLTGLAAFDDGNALAFLAICAGFKIPSTYLDLGCGTGAMVKIARRLGVEAYGVDILPHEEPFLLKQDLGTFCDLGRKFDLVTSIETAEHIAPEYAEILCDTYARHVRGDGGLLVLTAAPPGQIGDGHINCVIGETEVSASGIRAATRRRYDGQAVTIITRDQNELTVTPNHPVLTAVGWMPARLLQVGDYVFSRRATQGEAFCVMPNDDQTPTTIKEIFSAFSELQHARRLSVPLAAKDFHGDVTDSEVEIVYPDRLAELGNDTQLLQPFRKFPVQCGNTLSSSLDSFGAQDLSLNGILIPTALVDGMSNQVMLVGLRKSGHPYAVSLIGVSNCNAVAPENIGNTLRGTAQFAPDRDSRATRQILPNDPLNIKRSSQGFHAATNMDSSIGEAAARSSEINMRLTGQAGEGLPAGIARDEIVKIKRSNFRGHVYNLSTDSQMYFANHIITHNCQPKSYWREKLEKRGLRFDEWATGRLVTMWEQTHWATHWCEQNLQVFHRYEV